MFVCFRWDVPVHEVDRCQFPIDEKLEKGWALMCAASFKHCGYRGCGIPFTHVAEDPIIVIGDDEVRTISLLAGLVGLGGVGQRNVEYARASLTTAHRICALEILISPGVRSNSPLAN
jgi:hypothetical protein